MWPFKKKCKHVLKLSALKLTGIPEPEAPKENDYDQWSAYFSRYYDSDYVTKRVKWPCDLCGHVFFGHCGIDLMHHGEFINDNEETK